MTTRITNPLRSRAIRIAKFTTAVLLWLAVGSGAYGQTAGVAHETAGAVQDAESPDALLREARAPRADLKQLTFRPRDCRHFDRIQAALRPSDAALTMYDQQGLVVLRQKVDSNFGAAYYSIYRQDLPVLITSDSILHIFHRSFDNTLKESEENVLRPAIEQMLIKCHEELSRRVLAGVADPPSYRDIDLYLSVALRLLDRGTARRRLPELVPWNEVDQILTSIDSLKLQNPLHDETTKLYGGRRPIDYSQFQPRGHYTHTPALRSYFQAMMWLGRADCGFFPLGADKRSGIEVDADRELRDAVLLTELFAAANQVKPLEVVDNAVASFWGESDNLRPAQLQTLLNDSKLKGLTDLQNKSNLERLQAAVLKSSAGNQKIQSQVYFGGKIPGETIAPPALFQLFGQRFSVDSYVLANVVYDTVPVHDPRIGARWMPQAADVMATLGSPEALHELTGDLERWQYAPQLLAARQFTNRYFADPPGQQSIADLWLAALRTLHADRTNAKNFPQAMQTNAWRLKQLNAQLASWAELRHDGILFIKQSYTRQEECYYPNGFVEPYPEFYKRMGTISRRMAKNLADLQVRTFPSDQNTRARRHWTNFETTMHTLERIATKELNAEALADEDLQFLKNVVTMHTVPDDNSCEGGHVRAYTGWYCDLYYGRASDIDQFVPTVADVHTDSNTDSVLEVGGGRADLAVVAIDNGADRTAYVGPVSTYYEFRAPSAERMTDENFKQQLGAGNEPKRPAWIKAYMPAER